MNPDDSKEKRTKRIKIYRAEPPPETDVVAESEIIGDEIAKLEDEREEEPAEGNGPGEEISDAQAKCEEALEYEKAVRGRREEHIEELERNIDALTDSLQRERASFINYRHRMDEEKALIRTYGAQDLAFDLLNVLDYFESSLNFESGKSSDAQAVILGVKFTVEEMRRVLSKHGVVEIRTDIPFDPRIHEAFVAEATYDVDPGTILAVHRKGYMFKERVLRPAMVTVAKPPEETGKIIDVDQTELGTA